MIAVALVAALFVLGGGPGYRLYREISKASSEDPLVWEDDVAAFERAAAEVSPPRDAVVFVGSSSIRLWSTLEVAMAPIPVVQRGFGGAKLNDLVYYAERLVNAWGPRAVVVFAGTNDLHPGSEKSPETLLASYREFVRKVRADFPETPIYFIAITPSPLRFEVWPIAQQTNVLISRYSEQEKGLFVIDTGPALLAADGTPDPDNYRFDRLHLSARGYAIWSRIIRDRLLADLPELGGRLEGR